MISKALMGLGKPSTDPALMSRSLVELDGGALCAHPYHIPADKYVGLLSPQDGIFLHYLQALQPGGGARALVRLIEVAEAIPAPIVLCPIAYSTPLRPVTRTKEEMKAYYASFGFVQLVPIRPGKWSHDLMIRQVDNCQNSNG